MSFFFALAMTAALSATPCTAILAEETTEAAQETLTEVTEENAGEEAEEEAAPEAEDEDENYETGDASLDDPLNGDDISENELLVVSFGTSFNDNRRLSIGGIEKKLQETYPDWSVRRAFTSQIIIDHVKSRDGEVIDNVGEALERAVNNGVKHLFIQPTHLMGGFDTTIWLMKPLSMRMLLKR